MATEKAIDRTHLVYMKPDPMLGAPEIADETPHCEGEEVVRLNEGDLIRAVISLIDEDNCLCTELYDSGAT